MKNKKASEIDKLTTHYGEAQAVGNRNKVPAVRLVFTVALAVLP